MRVAREAGAKSSNLAFDSYISLRKIKTIFVTIPAHRVCPTETFFHLVEKHFTTYFQIVWPGTPVVRTVWFKKRRIDSSIQMTITVSS